MRTGDTVKHVPTGETWTVAFVEGDSLAWCGWPAGLAKISDCVLVKACGDEESVALLRRLASMGPNDHGTPDHRMLYAKRKLAEMGG